jgi:hypothetical protein
VHTNPSTHRRRHAYDDIGADADPFTVAGRHPGTHRHGNQRACGHTDSDAHPDPNRT